MVMVPEVEVPVHEAETPAGRPFTPPIPLLEIPVAPVVVSVILVKAVLIQTEGDEEAADTELVLAVIESV